MILIIGQKRPILQIFDEDAGFCLDFKDSRGKCSSIVIDIEQAKKIKYLLDELIEKHDLFVETKRGLIQRKAV